jgi:predicted phage terminase large subunit-like protein
LWGTRFSFVDDQNTKFNYANSEQGARQATSVGGSLLGLGGDILIADDLNNTEPGGESEAEQQTVADFWNEFHSTRLNDPKQSAVIVIQQRLRENDVSGLILNSDEDFVHLCIPMRYESDRTYHTVVLPQYEDEEPWDDPRSEDGELMWPERFGEAEVRKLETILGPYMAAGRLQQRPAPKGGGIIRREWWQPWDGEEARKYNLEWLEGGLKEFPSMSLIMGSLDTSYGEKEENDFNALTVWGIWNDKNKNRRAMLMYAWAKRLPLHGREVSAGLGEPRAQYEQRKKEAWGLIEWVADTCKRYKVQRLLIENKTRGRDVANEINRLYRRENWGVELVNPDRDKVARLHSVVPMFADNGIWAPDTKWADQVITQCALVPKADHDDLADTVSQFLNWARENGLLLMAEEMSSSIADESRYRPPMDNLIARQYGV